MSLSPQDIKLNKLKTSKLKLILEEFKPFLLDKVKTYLRLGKSLSLSIILMISMDQSMSTLKILKEKLIVSL
jgi:hypothetical protein